jgi:hypothetical protein
MGEAKRRLEEMKVAPCRCRSGRQSASCCFDGVRWHKPASGLDLRSGSPSTTLERCYMQELGNCEAPISGEHLISEAVIEILRGDGNFTASGLPWLEAGETKALAPKNLTANCLCRRHNSALSPLDAAAKIFFAGLRDCLESSEAVLPYLLSGHDVERWLLKTLKANETAAAHIGGKAPEKGAETTGREVRIAVRLVDRGERVPRPGPAPAAARLPPHGAHQQFRPPRTTPRSSEASRAAATRWSF